MKPLAGLRVDERYMRRAIALAERGLGETNPNPAVGCVLVLNGRVVGEGFHARAGSAHAEATALEAAGPKAHGATAYVTLEPCAPSEGKRTPPCAPRLIAAGVRRVVFGVRDANPRVRGGGARILRSGGVEVVEGVCADEAGRLVQHFNTAMRLGRPFVTLKAGMTLDGRVATASGESRWITSPAQRKTARSLRRLFDAVLVGATTAIHDDPVLLPVPRTRRPAVRVVLDSRLRLSPKSRLCAGARRHPLIIVCAARNPAAYSTLERCGAVVLPVRGTSGRVALRAALAALFKRGVTSLYVEGGSEVLGSFVREGLFDEFVLFRAPVILGGRSSLPVVGGDNPRRLAQATAMKRADARESFTMKYGFPTGRDLDVEVYVPRRSER